MSNLEMQRGLRHFLSMGGAWEEPSDRLIKIRDLCNEILKERKVPQAPVVHYLTDDDNFKGFKGERVLTSACSTRNVTLTDDNSTEKTEYVSCKNCTRSIPFRKAIGEEIDESRTGPIIHYRKTSFSGWGGGTYNVAVCNGFGGLRTTNKPLEVTCRSCHRSNKYKKKIGRSIGGKKAAETRKKNGEN